MTMVVKMFTWGMTVRPTVTPAIASEIAFSLATKIVLMLLNMMVVEMIMAVVSLMTVLVSVLYWGVPGDCSGVPDVGVMKVFVTKYVLCKFVVL